MLPGRQYTPEDIAAIAWRYKWLILSAVCVVTTIAIAVSLRLPNRYRSETLILVIPQRVPESYVRSTVTLRIEDRLRSISQEILSRSRLERIIQDFNLYTEELKRQPMEQVVATMRLNAVIDTVRDDAFSVSFVADSPRTAMIVADRLATMSIEENLRDREGQADSTHQFLESQLTEARERLVMHEEKLEAYRRQYSGELPSQLQGNLQIIQGIQNQIETLTESINRDRDRRLSLERSMNDALDITGAPADFAVQPGAGSRTQESRLIDELDKARTELAALQSRLTPQHPDVVAKVRTIAELEAKIAGATAAPAPGGPAPVSQSELTRRSRTGQYQSEIDKLDVQIGAKEADMQRLRQMMSDYQRRVEAVPGHESELTALTRDYDTLQKLYAELLGKREASQISANLERQPVGEQFRILDPARLPVKPFSPDRPRFALAGAAVGLVFALALIAFLEFRDVALRTEDDVVRTLVLPVIAAIPMMTAAVDLRRRRRNAGLVAVATITAVAAVSVAIWRMTQ